MRLVEQLYAVDELRQVHTVLVYKGSLGKYVYRLDDRESVEPLDEKWFVTLTGDVLERVFTAAQHPDEAR
jgi:hypothetical protein